MEHDMENGMTAVIRACVAGAMAGVVLVTTCAVTTPSVAAAQAAQQVVPPPATNAPPPPAAPVPSEVQPVQPPLPAPPSPPVPPAEVAPPVPTEATPPPPEAPAPGSTFVVAPPPAETSVPAAPEPVEQAAEPPSKLPSYVLWGTGAASLIVGAVFGGLALSAKHDFDDNPTFDRADTVDHRALVADVAFGLGIVLAVTGTVFFFAHEPSADQPTQAQAARDHHVQLSVAPIISPHAGGGALQVRF
jgi:hypothetical protein